MDQPTDGFFITHSEKNPKLGQPHAVHQLLVVHRDHWSLPVPTKPFIGLVPEVFPGFFPGFLAPFLAPNMGRFLDIPNGTNGLSINLALSDGAKKLSSRTLMCLMWENLVALA